MTLSKLRVFSTKYSHKKALSYKNAICMSILWFLIAIIFGFSLMKWQGYNKGIDFFTAYLVEKTLSFDNVMIFAVIFQSLSIPVFQQQRLLMWGILSALVMRMIMIFIGISLLKKFSFLLIVFGSLLIITSIGIFLSKNKEKNPADNKIFEWIKTKIPLIEDTSSGKMWIRSSLDGRLKATPLFIALLCIEFSDIIFAVDSIPAIFSITQDPFIIYTSNIFAILGLRSLYSIVAIEINKYTSLKKGLAVILFFIGIKMMGLVKIEPLYSLAVIILIIIVTIIFSKFYRENKK